MAASKNQIQAKWSTANTHALTFGSSQDSDTIAISATCLEFEVQCKADNAGTPAAGDTVDWRIKFTLGDPDADPDSADEYDSNTNAKIMGRLDTNANDPALRTFGPYSGAAKGVTLRATSNAASNSITISAQIREILFA